MRVHFVIHESFEAPGAFDLWAGSRGYSMDYSRVYAGDRLPESAEHFDLLIVLGGPQTPATTKGECPYFDAEAEEALIAKAISSGRAVVGMCLGAQLIGEALGAQYEPSPQKEIGKFAIMLTDAGAASEKVSHFGRSLGVGHWHNDMPGLTASSMVLAYSEGCPRQIIEYSTLVYGFQCHMEFTLDVIELLIAAFERELPTLTHERFVQQPESLRRNDYNEMNEKLFVFLDKLVLDYQKQRDRQVGAAA